MGKLLGLGDAELRRQTSRELNKGETRNSLARAVFIHRLGEIRDRTYENQQHRASGLNLLVTAIILWNTRYLERAVAALRQTEDVPDQLLAHLSPDHQPDPGQSLARGDWRADDLMMPPSSKELCVVLVFSTPRSACWKG